MAALPSGSPPPSPARLPASSSGVTARASTPPGRIQKGFHLFLLLLFLLSSFPDHSSSTDISYSDHCGSFVPDSTPSDTHVDSDSSFRISSGYFVGGDRLVGQDSSADFSIPRSFSFHSRSVLRTHTSGTLQVLGTLIFRGGGAHFGFAHRNLTSRGRSLRLVRPWNARSFNQRRRVSFSLTGFWSEETGKLCMVGAGTGRSKDGISLNPSAVLKLRYPSASNITSSVVIGNLESLDSLDSPNYFAPITLHAYAQRKYVYTKVSQARSSCSAQPDAADHSTNFLDRRQSICDAPGNFLSTRLKLEYNLSGCSDKNCSPLPSSLAFQPKSLKFTFFDCAEDGSFRAVVLFSNSSDLSPLMLLEPGRAMVAEGSWDHNKRQFCLTACPINTVSDALADNPVGECTVGISLAFPAVLTIDSRSSTVGRIWSYLNESNPGFFGAVLFQSFGYNGDFDLGLRYNYTKMDAVRKSCIVGDTRTSGGKRYPDPRNYRDFMFYLLIRTSDGNVGSGFASPVALGETIYHYSSLDLPALVPKDEIVWNLSYNLKHAYNLNKPFDSLEGDDTSAEGIYNSRTGMICMVGCRSSSSGKQGNNAASKDCSVLINLQIPPLNSQPGDKLNGTIRSTRAKGDPLYFEPLEISSYVMYTEQAAESFWRMDMEIVMVLISLTFSCIFITLQLFHANKHPGVLPSISITMLVILTLGHMIILVLNFEAFLSNHKKQNVLQGSGGWLEVNEVVVRLMTMAAFLLHFRLLQLAWAARSANEGKTSLWLAERRTVLFCLLIYIVGGFFAWFLRPKPQKVFHQVPHLVDESPKSHWDDMQSFAGLTLDFFLCPQVMFNVLCNSKEPVLASPFYIGTTILRALPHAYDAYRSSRFVPRLNSTFIYAEPNSDLYSLAWDIIIPCGGIAFAVITYIQQRFSGDSILCRRIRSPALYEMVPVSSS